MNSATTAIRDRERIARDLVRAWPQDRVQLGISELLDRLDPATYAPWRLQDLARRLRALGVPSVMIQVTEGPGRIRNCRGVTYRDIWDRYLVCWEARHPAPKQGPVSAAVWFVVQVAYDAARLARGRGLHR